MDEREQKRGAEARPDASLQDAILLWSDTCRILAAQAGNSRRVAMMEACEPVSVVEDLLTVRTQSSFAKRSLDEERDLLTSALSDAAFQPMDLVIEYEVGTWEGSEDYPELITRGLPENIAWFDGSRSRGAKGARDAKGGEDGPAQTGEPAPVIPIGLARTSISEDEFRSQVAEDESLDLALSARSGAASVRARSGAASADAKPKPNPFDTVLGDNDSKLTFETFVRGVENEFALTAAKQVANGNTSQYNPLFIYGDSGLGKTHLLMSIKNYVAQNDPARACVYRIARDFISDYTNAMNGDRSIRDSLTQYYRDVDVLILDDIQNLRGAVRTVEFFFDTFNYLISNGKQIVLAADVPPAELGLDDRIKSRMGQGFDIPIQLPQLELKRNLVRTFYQRDKQDGLPGYEGTIADDVLDIMAECSGGDIRLIKAYVQKALFLATQLERSHATFTADDARHLAKEKWPHGHHRVTVEEVQSLVEHELGVSHGDLVGNKRNKEIAQARHVAIWLCRQLTDLTYKEIGSRFGNRSHTTCLHSCEFVDNALQSRTDRTFIETVTTLRRRLETM